MRAFETLLGKQGPMGPAALLTLPDELLTLIAMELPQDDLLTARRTCQALGRVCAMDQVWRHLFLVSLGRSIPTPFFLAQPISEIPASGIERALRRWQERVAPNNPVRHVLREARTEVLAGREYLQNTVTLLPGGRWVLVGYADGSVWYYDLSDDWTSTSTVEPRLLIPGFTTKTNASIDEIQMEVALDWASSEAMGPSAGVHTLMQFNIAVLTCPDRELFPDYDEPMQVDVWRILVRNGPEGEDLQLGEHLSSFTEDPTPGLTNASLLGSVLAYSNSAHPHRYVAIVDWSKANGRTKLQSLERWCIHFSNKIEIVRLIPGNRILVVYDGSDYTLINWELDCPSTTEAPHEAIVHGLASPLPVWRFETHEYTLHLAISHPLVIDGSIRIPLPTHHGLYILTVPLNDHTRRAIHFKRAAKSRLGEGAFIHIAHFQKAVGLRGEDGYKKIYYAEYPWTGDALGESTPNSTVHVVDYPFDDLGTESPGNLLFDQYSNRVVVTDNDGSRFFTVLAPICDGSPAHVSTKRAVTSIAEGSEDRTSEGDPGVVETPTKDGRGVVEGAEEKGVDERSASAEIGSVQGGSAIDDETVAPASQGEPPELEGKCTPSEGGLPDDVSTDENSDRTWTEDSPDGGSEGGRSDEPSQEASEVSLGEGRLSEGEHSGDAPNRTRDSTSVPDEAIGARE